jgi:predicted SAM-dependent methyltransferase
MLGQKINGIVWEYQRRKHKKLIDQKQQNKLPVMFNIGCGTDYKKDWINVDNNTDNNIEELDLNWDLRKRLPFKDNSADFTYNEHFIEHLTVEESQKVIKDLMRVLKPGGVLRIATPDLESVVKQYLDPKLEQDPLIKNWDMSFIRTRAESINMSFRFWGHEWIYDWEELKRRLEEAGCVNIKRSRINQSQHLELRGLETRKESLLIVEITK